jgi:plastocyanin
VTGGEDSGAGLRSRARARAGLGALAPSLGILLILGAVPGPTAAATLLITALRENGKPLPQAVITVHSLDGAAKQSAPIHAVMDQVNEAFTPDLLVIPVGSTVSFPNSDTTSHEVYSFSPAHPFQLPLYHGHPYPPERFDKAGLVTLGCNIHDFMLAYIVVTDASFYGQADAHGMWSAAQVPAGRYRIEIWHPRLASGEHPSREIIVTEAQRAAISIRLVERLRPAPLDERLPSWDAY